jgi:hypothetical protein
VFFCEGMLEQRIVIEIDLADREVVGGSLCQTARLPSLPPDPTPSLRILPTQQKSCGLSIVAPVVGRCGASLTIKSIVSCAPWETVHKVRTLPDATGVATLHEGR